MTDQQLPFVVMVTKKDLAIFSVMLRKHHIKRAIKNEIYFDYVEAYDRHLCTLFILAHNENDASVKALSLVKNIINTVGWGNVHGAYRP